MFELKHKTFENEDFPVLYIQVIPLLSYGPSFNFSIWFIELLGLEDDLIVCNTLQHYYQQKEKTTIRLILKHLRCKGHFEAFEALSRETGIRLEDPELTELYKCLVDAGDFKKVEDLMEKLIDSENSILSLISRLISFLLQMETSKTILQSKSTKPNLPKSSQSNRQASDPVLVRRPPTHSTKAAS